MHMAWFHRYGSHGQCTSTLKLYISSPARGHCFLSSPHAAKKSAAATMATCHRGAHSSGEGPAGTAPRVGHEINMAANGPSWTFEVSGRVKLHLCRVCQACVTQCHLTVVAEATMHLMCGRHRLHMMNKVHHAQSMHLCLGSVSNCSGGFLRSCADSPRLQGFRVHYSPLGYLFGPPGPCSPSPCICNHDAL